MISSALGYLKVNSNNIGKNFAGTPLNSSSHAKSSMYMRNITGPMALSWSWTIPLNKLDTVDRACPTLVWCE